MIVIIYSNYYLICLLNYGRYIYTLLGTCNYYSSKFLNKLKYLYIFFYIYIYFKLYYYNV